jgi:hypothetical protein
VPELDNLQVDAVIARPVPTLGRALQCVRIENHRARVGGPGLVQTQHLAQLFMPYWYGLLRIFLKSAMPSAAYELSVPSAIAPGNQF